MRSRRNQRGMLNPTKFAGALVVLGVLAATAVGTAAGKSTKPKVSPIVAQAKKVVAAATAKNVPWTGPTTGPKAQKNKSIVVIASDLTNTGVLAVSQAIQKAASSIGWKVTVLNGAGTTSGLTSALNQAIALKPNGIVDDGYDFTTVAPLEAQIHSAGIPQVAWNGGPVPGPAKADNIFYNVTVSAPQISQIAADYAIARSNGKAKVVIFTDNEFSVAQTKANLMQAAIKKCSTCQVLAYENTPIADATRRVPPLTSALLGQYGKGWTYSLAINDNYFEAMAPALAADGVSNSAAPINISAGDGSPDAFQRIRTGNDQAATVAAPLSEQGWEVVDQMNRAIAGKPADNFVAAPRLFDRADIGTDGGPQNTYVPNNNYQRHYKNIWGVK